MKNFRILKYIVICTILGIVGLAALLTDWAKDQEGPVFQSEMDVLTVSTGAEDVDLLEGLTAMDEVDGDVTASIIIEQISRIRADGSRTITYGAFDSSNNVSKYTRTLQYTDYRSPRFSLKGALIFQSWDLSTALNMIQVTDCIDGNITNKMKLYSVENGTSRNRILTVYVTNSSGETLTQSFPVEILNVTSEEYANMPQLSLSQYVVYKNAGDAEDNWETYLQSVKVVKGMDNIGGALQDTEGNLQDIEDLSQVNISAETDMDRPGIYTVDYTYTDEMGSTGKTRLFVIVEE